MILYHSTIFKTITTDLDGAINKIGIFNKSFADLRNAMVITNSSGNINNGISGLLNSISSTITSKDILNIKEYNRLVSQEGVSSQTAWYKTMMSSSKAAQSLFDNENNLVESNGKLILSDKALTTAQNTMTTSARASEAAMKALSIAANMAVMIAINLAIKGAIALWDKYNVTVAETQEKIDGINSSLQTLNSEYNELNSRDIDTLSDSEKARLEYLEKRIDAEKRLLEIEKKKQAQEAIGTKITDAFDKDNLNNQYSKIVDDYLRYDGQIKNDLKKYQENLAKFGKTGDSKYKDNADKYESDIDRKIVILQENYEKLLSIKETLQSYIDDELLSGDDLTKAQTLIANIDGSLGQHKSIIDDVNNTVSKTIDKADALAERLKNVSSEELQESFSTDEIVALGEIEFDENATIEDLKKALEEAQKEADENPVEGTISFEDSLTQLKSLSGQITKMSDMLADKNNGTVASISDLAGFDAEVRGLDSWEEFERVMGSSKSSMEECQAAANALASEWINNGNFLANLTDQNRDYYETQLKNMGIGNAHIIVLENLAKAGYELSDAEQAELDKAIQAREEIYALQVAEAKSFIAKKDLNVAAQDAYAGLLQEAEGAGVSKVALLDLIAQEQVFNNTGLSVNSKISQLSTLASAYLGTAAAARFAANTSVSGMGSDPRYFTDSYVQDQWMAELSNYKVKFDLSQSGSSGHKGGSSRSSGSGGSGSSGSSSSTSSKTTIDWIERKLTVLQNKIDLTKAKFENLFTLKGKKNNLSTQIAQTETLLKATEKAADRYLKKANKVGLSKSLKKKVKNGSYNISNYSSSTAEKIQRYEEYYDKYKKLKLQEKQLKTDARNLKIQKQQLISDNAQAKIDRSNAKMALDEGNYKKQNVHLEAQKKYLKEKYDAEIAIATVNKDTVEQKKLEAEYQKEINDLTKQEFDNIVATYDKKLGITSGKRTLIQDDLALAEAKGEIIGSRYYTKQIALNNVDLRDYQSEREKLSAKLLNFKPFSDEWYDARKKLFEVDDYIKQIEIDNVNLQNSINQLKFDRFDDLLNKLSDITDESDFLISLLDSDNLFDDKGNITDDGLTAMGLTAMNYDTYMAQADKYKQWQAEVQTMYDNGDIGYEEYTSKMREYQQGQRQSIQSAKDCRDAVIDYMKQGLDAQNEALAESIDKQKELLRSEKD